MPLAKVGEHEHEAGFEVVVARTSPSRCGGTSCARVVDHIHNPPKRSSLPQMRARLVAATKSANVSGSLWMPCGLPLRTKTNSNITCRCSTCRSDDEDDGIAAATCCRDHDHGRDLGLRLYQPWRRLLRWWRLGLGREALGFVCERDDEKAALFIGRGGGGAVALINAGTQS
ncbi:hypothetical protein QYE76_040629 [Lolium multiflorum]|uniref:Uncharacterized protein n=1 Tax=Lolium multiflorum TaxID=4521 RepID=A0AAD8TDQ2_LOLMU|nr:hypothetical protein QYE76_040629 [Lolium multiflorum]